MAEPPAILEDKEAVVRNISSDNVLESVLLETINISNILTDREIQILHMIISGRTNKKIAEKLSRSERTVEYHRNHLMGKLGAHSAADLVKKAIAMGIN